jgi:16S rRNA A1518/A1519 N6-dimethyltransferase RsmA/KsgA/DIM1 with predicted DNA glycosylase/AP lyase activity
MSLCTQELMGGAQSSLVDSRWLDKALDHAECGQGEVIFVMGAGDGQLPSILSNTCKIMLVEPDASLAQYFYTLELYRTIVINSQPHQVMGDIPFDKILCVQPELASEAALLAMLKVPFKHAVMIMPEETLGITKKRTMLATLLRSAFDIQVIQSVPKNAFAPLLDMKTSLVTIKHRTDKDPVACAIQLCIHESAGTMRGLLTRACREYFGYTLADAQGVVRQMDQTILKKTFWQLSEAEFKDVYAWLKLG